MNSRQEKIVEEYLEEDYDSDISTVDDPDADPNYYPHDRNVAQDSFRNSPDPFKQSTSSSSALVLQTQNLDLSNDEISTEVSSSSDENENDFDDSDDWVDDYKSIFFFFEFDSNSSGIKLNIPESAKDSPIEIFNKIWTHDILEVIISFTNNYGKNLTRNKSTS